MFTYARMCKKIAHMFTYASMFDQDLSEWNVKNVVDMRGVFWEAISFHRKLCWDLKDGVVMDWIFFGGNSKFSCEQ